MYDGKLPALTIFIDDYREPKGIIPREMLPLLKRGV